MPVPTVRSRRVDRILPERPAHLVRVRQLACGLAAPPRAAVLQRVAAAAAVDVAVLHRVAVAWRLERGGRVVRVVGGLLGVSGVVGRWWGDVLLGVAGVAGVAVGPPGVLGEGRAAGCAFRGEVLRVVGVARAWGVDGGVVGVGVGDGGAGLICWIGGLVREEADGWDGRDESCL